MPMACSCTGNEANGNEQEFRHFFATIDRHPATIAPFHKPGSRLYSCSSGFPSVCPAAQEYRVKSASAVLALLPATALALYMGLPPTSQATSLQESSMLLAQLAHENSQLAARLEDAHEELLALEDKNAVLRMEYHWLEQEKSGLQLASTGMETPAGVGCCADTELVLHFRSDSAVVEKHYRADLAAFVDTALAIPGAVVELVGHADKRGNADTNLQLSRARLAAVEHRLRELGLQNVLVETTALGARHAKGDGDSAEDAFFDRRVEVRIRTVGRQLLSSKD